MGKKKKKKGKKKKKWITISSTWSYIIISITRAAYITQYKISHTVISFRFQPKTELSGFHSLPYLSAGSLLSSGYLQIELLLFNGHAAHHNILKLFRSDQLGIYHFFYLHIFTLLYSVSDSQLEVLLTSLQLSFFALWRQLSNLYALRKLLDLNDFLKGLWLLCCETVYHLFLPHQLIYFEFEVVLLG